MVTTIFLANNSSAASLIGAKIIGHGLPNFRQWAILTRFSQLVAKGHEQSSDLIAGTVSGSLLWPEDSETITIVQAPTCTLHQQWGKKDQSVHKRGAEAVLDSLEFAKIFTRIWGQFDCAAVPIFPRTITFRETTYSDWGSDFPSRELSHWVGACRASVSLVCVVLCGD